MPWAVKFGLCLLGMAITVGVVVLGLVLLFPNDTLVDYDEEEV